MYALISIVGREFHLPRLRQSLPLPSGIGNSAKFYNARPIIYKGINMNVDNDLSFTLKPHSGYIYDVRDRKNPKIVGLIIRTSSGRGYTLCPRAKQTIGFDAAVPDQVKSPKKMQHWVMEHAVLWNASRKYTVFNSFMKILAPFPRVFHILRDLRLSVIYLQLVVCTLIYTQHYPGDVIGWLILIVLFVWALINIAILCKEHHIFDRRI